MIDIERPYRFFAFSDRVLLPVLGLCCLGVALLTACDGGGGVDPPEVAGSISNQELVAGEDPTELELNPLFSGEELTFSVSPSDSGIIDLTISGSTLVLDPLDGGEETVTVTGENDAGRAEVSFDVTVNLANPPGSPPS